MDTLGIPKIVVVILYSDGSGKFGFSPALRFAIPLGVVGGIIGLLHQARAAQPGQLNQSLNDLACGRRSHWAPGVIKPRESLKSRVIRRGQSSGLVEPFSSTAYRREFAAQFPAFSSGTHPRKSVRYQKVFLLD
jgi:hypothetical protein